MNLFRLMNVALKGIEGYDFKDWVITDIDNFLKGNPHVPSS